MGAINRSPWLMGGAALAAVLTLGVVRFGKAFDRRRAEIAAGRAELGEEARDLARAMKGSRDS